MEGVMNITAAKYYKSPNMIGDATTIKATIDGQELFVPIDEGNRHYKAILAWVADGNTIEEAD
jgi:hypothetical protein